jgi:transcriptional regulator with XRE-family HTH domain
LVRKFGRVVRRFREAAGVSQEALADRAGLHRTYISLLERGLRNPSLTVISKLAKALHTSMTALISELEGE